MATYLAQVVGMLSSMSLTISIKSPFPIDPDRIPQSMIASDTLTALDDNLPLLLEVLTLAT